MSKKKPPPNPGATLLVKPPSAARRKWINLGIAIFLASQIAIPLTYYLYKEPTDERFAWRMFSSVHMGDWNRLSIVQVTRSSDQIRQLPVPVKELLILSSWENLYKGQPDVRDKFLKQFLETSPADQIVYEAQGIWPSGKPMQPIRRTIHRGDGIIRTMNQ